MDEMEVGGWEGVVTIFDQRGWKSFTLILGLAVMVQNINDTLYA